MVRRLARRRPARSAAHRRGFDGVDEVRPAQDRSRAVRGGGVPRLEAEGPDPELQGRFPIRVELESLSDQDFVRILTEPENALTKQYTALLATEKVTLDIRPDAVAEIARIATLVNARMENIGARRFTQSWSACWTTCVRGARARPDDDPDHRGLRAGAPGGDPQGRGLSSTSCSGALKEKGRRKQAPFPDCRGSDRYFLLARPGAGVVRTGAGAGAAAGRGRAGPRDGAPIAWPRPWRSGTARRTRGR